MDDFIINSTIEKITAQDYFDESGNVKRNELNFDARDKFTKFDDENVIKMLWILYRKTLLMQEALDDTMPNYRFKLENVIKCRKLAFRAVTKLINQKKLWLAEIRPFISTKASATETEPKFIYFYIYPNDPRINFARVQTESESTYSSDENIDKIKKFYDKIGFIHKEKLDVTQTPYAIKSMDDLKKMSFLICGYTIKRIEMVELQEFIQKYLNL
jgi:hypothetical protein